MPHGLVERSDDNWRDLPVFKIGRILERFQKVEKMTLIIRIEGLEGVYESIDSKQKRCQSTQNVVDDR